jgi:site-specific DNA-methyltransferase (adenine-specific)/modification methylase
VSGDCALATPRPYWQSPDGRIVVYHYRWEDVHAAGLLPVREVALVHADPPYGIDLDTDARWPWLGDFPPVVNDAGPFDPSSLLDLGRPSVLWGANHYASKLPDAKGWFAWDKATKNGLDLKQAEMEFAWTNCFARPQCFRHMWSGAFRESERGSRLGPCQKPIALSSYVFQRAKLRPGDLVFVPYLGSGPDLPAAVAMGLRVIACDVESWCCRTAVGRLGAINQEAAAEPVGPLFEARS